MLLLMNKYDLLFLMMMMIKKQIVTDIERDRKKIFEHMFKFFIC